MSAYRWITSPAGYPYEDLERADGTAVTTITEPEDRTGCRDMAPVADELNRLAARVKELEAEKERLKDVLHLDQTGLAAGINACREAARGWSWLAAGEWGSYDYTQHTEETLRGEVRNLLDAIEERGLRALQKSGKLAHAECCGSGQARVVVDHRDTARDAARLASLAPLEAAAREYQAAADARQKDALRCDSASHSDWLDDTTRTQERANAARHALLAAARALPEE